MKNQTQKNELVESRFEKILETKLIHEISDVGNLFNIKNNEYIHSFTDYKFSFPIVLSGMIKLSRIDLEGNELLLYYVEAGDTCAISLNFEANKIEQRIFATAIDDTTIIFIPKEYMDKWLINYSSWRKFILNTFQFRFNELLDSIDNLAFNKLEKRLSNYLLEKSKVCNSNELQLNHQSIADELNSSRSVISRTLKILEKEKKIKLYRNKIKLNFD